MSRLLILIVRHQLAPPRNPAGHLPSRVKASYHIASSPPFQSLSMLVVPGSDRSPFDGMVILRSGPFAGHGLLCFFTRTAMPLAFPKAFQGEHSFTRRFNYGPGTPPVDLRSANSKAPLCYSLISSVGR